MRWRGNSLGRALDVSPDSLGLSPVVAVHGGRGRRVRRHRAGAGRQRRPAAQEGGHDPQHRHPRRIAGAVNAKKSTIPGSTTARSPLFVTAGRLVPQKDHETLLSAMALHRRSGGSAKTAHPRQWPVGRIPENDRPRHWGSTSPSASSAFGQTHSRGSVARTYLSCRRGPKVSAMCWWKRWLAVHRSSPPIVTTVPGKSSRMDGTGCLCRPAIRMLWPKHSIRRVIYARNSLPTC